MSTDEAATVPLAQSALLQGCLGSSRGSFNCQQRWSLPRNVLELLDEVLSLNHFL